MDDESELDEILAAILEAEEEGRMVEAARLADAHPHLRDRLHGCLVDLRKMDRMFTPLREALSSGDADADADDRSARLPNGATLAGSFGGYEILELVGQGGMGRVYRARQSNPERIVALKMVRENALASEVDHSRFRTETAAIAAIEHPHVVHIHEVGESEGRLFYTMTWHAGGSLSSRLREFQGEPRRAAELAATIADAIHHVHQRGVLHRDLKPSNILMDAEGRPHVGDFGLAAWVVDSGGERDRTRTGTLVGSPRYMAPEQIKGERTRMTTVTDVYGLGAILYALLTGQPPIQGDDIVETLEHVRNAPPVPPRSLNPRVDRDLETICLKCLAKEPGGRYASALALAEDLRRWLAGLPIMARPVSVREKLLRWCRRNPVLAGVACLLVVALCGLSAMSVILALQNAEIVRQTTLADRHRRKAEAHVYAANMHQASLAVTSPDNLRLTEDLLARHLPKSEGEDLRGFEWHYLQNRCESYGKPLRELDCHKQAIFCVAFSPDGRLLATTGDDGAARVWDVRTGRLVYELTEFTDDANSVEFSRDGEWLVATGEDGLILRCAARTGQQRRQLAKFTSANPGGLMPVTNASFSPDGKVVAAACNDGWFRVLDFETGETLHAFECQPGQYSTVHFSRDGRVIAGRTPRQGVFFWGWPSRQLLRHDAAFKGLTTMAFGRQTDTVVSGDLAGSIRRHASWQGDATATWNIDQVARSVALSPDERLLASIGDKGIVEIREPTGKRLHSYRGHESVGWAVTFDPTGKTIVSSGRDGKVKWWDATARDRVGQITRQQGLGRTIAVSPDGKTLATGWSGGTVYLQELSPNQILPQQTQGAEAIHLGKATVTGLAFLPDSRRLVVSGHDGDLGLWDLDSRKPLWRLKNGNNNWNIGLAVTPDGRWLITGGSPLRLEVRSLANGEVIRTLAVPGPRNELLSFALAPDGRRLAVAGVEGEMALVDVVTGTTLRTFPRNAPVSSLAFAPDGKSLAAGRMDSILEVWRDDESPPQAHLESFRGGINRLAYTADGRTLVASSPDGKISLLHPGSGQEMLVLRPGNRRFWSFAVTPDGRRIFGAGESDEAGTGEILQWDARASVGPN